MSIVVKVTRKEFIKPGPQGYINVTLNGERLTDAVGAGLILTEKESYLQEVLGGMIVEAFKRGREVGRTESLQEGYEAGIRACIEALDNLP